MEEGGKRKRNTKPKWLSCGNFLCLLNLPDVMNDFGPLRNLWEGKNHGKQFLRCVKCEVPTSLIGDWQVWPIKKIYQKQALDLIIDGNEKNSVQEPNESSCRSGNLCLYKSVASVIKDFLEVKPLSMVMLSNGATVSITTDFEIVEFT